jgi:hypothetical protein
MRAKALLVLVGLLAAFVIAAPTNAQEKTKRSGEQQEPEQADTTWSVSREKATSDDDIEALRRAATAEAEKDREADEDAGETTFKSGNLGLQALNPEFSVTGDMLGKYQSGRDEVVTWDTVFRTLGLHLESYLDPYSRFKAAAPISTEGAELGEAYFTRYGLLGRTNLTLGKFRQQFGVVNRWHKHALDWFDFPLALRAVFGPGGLNQIGLSLEWGGSTGPVVHGLIVEVTDAENPLMFGQNTRNRPAILAHYKAYQDLSPSTYLEVGLTGLVGWNDDWSAAVDTSFDAAQVAAYTAGDPRPTSVYGVDFTVVWEPTDRMRYTNIQWRSEGYLVDKELLAPDGSGVDQLTPWGFYTLVQAKVSRTVEAGVRYDYFSPETKDYANTVTAPALVPLAISESDAYRQLAGAWLTWWQSPFVKFRGGYSYEDGRGTGPDVQHVTLQVVFAAGPHKHERY